MVRDDVETFNGERIALVRSLREVRGIARDWRTYSSGVAGRVVIPAEDDVRHFNQIPVEVDPPDHTSFRQLLEPWFRRAHDDQSYIAAVEEVVTAAVDAMLQKRTLDVVADYALPLQSRALSVLLGLPISEADTWISWGVHAFRVDGVNDPEKAATLDNYLTERIEMAKRDGGDDLFGFLVNREVDGQKLDDTQVRGITHLTFAGGRDTVIHALTATVAHFAVHPEDLERVAQDASLTLSATEELVRATSPLPLIGRTCTRDVDHPAGEVPAGERIGLCWAEANHDETIFSDPHEVLIDRKPNPHVGFGAGIHTCLGAPHARLVIRSAMEIVAKRTSRIEIIEADERLLSGSSRHQKYAYRELNARLTPR